MFLGVLARTQRFRESFVLQRDDFQVIPTKFKLRPEFELTPQGKRIIQVHLRLHGSQVNFQMDLLTIRIFMLQKRFQKKGTSDTF
jgi:hypothetical protein